MNDIEASEILTEYAYSVAPRPATPPGYASGWKTAIAIHLLDARALIETVSASFCVATILGNPADNKRLACERLSVEQGEGDKLQLHIEWGDASFGDYSYNGKYTIQWM
jgi:hypothetical protein